MYVFNLKNLNSNKFFIHTCNQINQEQYMQINKKLLIVPKNKT